MTPDPSPSVFPGSDTTAPCSTSESATAYRHIHIMERGGKVAAVKPIASATTPRWAQDVDQAHAHWAEPSAEPLFRPPIPFVVPPPDGSGEPFYSHNHCPSVTWCENGDLLAAWFNTIEEAGTEMTILASRLRAGSEGWDPAAEFFKAPDRNMTGTALFHDDRGTLWHCNGVGEAGRENYQQLAMVMRTSRDNGVTWTPAWCISSGHRYARGHLPMNMSVTPNGAWILVADSPSIVHVSKDRGATWVRRQGEIDGIHAGVVGLGGGRLLAFARGERDGCMPVSMSDDLGQTWTHSPGPFPPIHWAQRLVLMRLQEGPLLLVSFTNATHRVPREAWSGLTFKDQHGDTFTGYGLFAALSLDDGKTWPIRKLLAPAPGEYDGKGHTKTFTATATLAEPKGYLAAAQTPDRVIHLLSSGLHYRFNLPWIELPNRAPSS